MKIMKRRAPLDCIFHSLLVWAAAGMTLGLTTWSPPASALWFWGVWLPLLLAAGMVIIIPLVFIGLLLWPKF